MSETQHNATTEQEGNVPPKYHFKWMLALMLVSMLATLVFELIKKNYSG